MTIISEWQRPEQARLKAGERTLQAVLSAIAATISNQPTGDDKGGDDGE